MSHVCSVSDCQSLDESGLNYLGVPVKMTRASYTNNCDVTYEPSREKIVFGVSDQVRHKPSSTATVDGYMLAI